MSPTSPALKSLLFHKEAGPVRLDGIRPEGLKRAATFWFPRTVARMKRSDIPRSLEVLDKDPTALKAGLDKLSAAQRELLGVFKRNGGALPGRVVTAEARSRGMIPEPTPGARPHYSQTRNNEPIHDLIDDLVLIPTERERSTYYNQYYYPSYGREMVYPETFVRPSLLNLVTVAAPQPWKPSVAAAPPSESVQRQPAEVALDLAAVVQTLAAGWKANKSGALPKNLLTRLDKLLAVDEADPLTPPSPGALYYGLLRALDFVEIDDFDHGTLRLKGLYSFLSEPTPMLAWGWARAWVATSWWVDGLGESLPNPGSGYGPERFRGARQVLAWALGRIALGDDDWLDLAGFLDDLCLVVDKRNYGMYCQYAWRPSFLGTREDAFQRDRNADPIAQQRASWLVSEGAWVANAVMSTLVFLGLVERGFTGKTRPCFRLTPIGRAVFGAPDRPYTAPETAARFLTVQPNLEVLAFLDDADAGAIGPLARIARRSSGPGQRVQTFVLSRDSVYQGLESGLTLAEIEAFLVAHSKTGMPAVVSQSLRDWSRGRDRIVVRGDVALAVQLRTRPDRGVPVGEGFFLAPPESRGSARGMMLRDHATGSVEAWRVDEEGRFTVADKADLIARARLAQFTEVTPSGPRLTAAAVRKARERGVTPKQILDWLHAHTEGVVPALVETALRNWAEGGRIYLGEATLLQVPDTQVCLAVQTSLRIQPLLAEYIPPHWFLVKPGQRAALEALLRELGFTTDPEFLIGARAREAAAERPTLAPPPKKKKKRR